MEGKRMLNKIKILIAVAVLSGTVSANVHAETVTVEKGDTLWELSRVHNTTVENIQTVNDLNTDIIRPGDVLNIASKKVYTVKPGETIWDIAKNHNVTIAQIKKWNKLSTDFIHPGLNLLIYENTSKKAAKTSKLEKPAVKKPAPAKVKSASKSKATGNVQKKSNGKPKKNPNKKVITVNATAYTAYCKGCSGITKTGINLRKNPNKKVIAVDPSVIPLGSKVHIEGFGKAIAADIGGAIKGKRIDIFIPSKKRAINFGVKKLKVTILN